MQHTYAQTNFITTERLICITQNCITRLKTDVGLNDFYKQWGVENAVPEVLLLCFWNLDLKNGTAQITSSFLRAFPLYHLYLAEKANRGTDHSYALYTNFMLCSYVYSMDLCVLSLLQKFQDSRGYSALSECENPCAPFIICWKYIKKIELINRTVKLA